MSNRLKPGDIVVSKLGGEKMLVNRFDPATGLWECLSTTERGFVYSSKFHQDCLVLATKGKANATAK